MAKVFVSHANADLTQAGQVHDWLVDADHQVFLDRDPRHGITVGEQWEQRLYEQLDQADAMVCVVTSAYLASTWCAAEVGIARAKGIRLLPLRAEQRVVHPLLTSTQYTDLTRDRDEARAAVLEALRQVDAGGTGWPDDRCPFPGLRPFDADLHRVFFGRAEEVRKLAGLLRSPADSAAQLVVGPSGCGKSSLVRAGLVPMMADEPDWWALPAMVPGADPVGTLVRELAAAGRRVGLDWTVTRVQDQLTHDGLAASADELLLAVPSGPRRQLLIVVDQFEELLTQTTPPERARFVELLRAALTGPVRVVGTLRPEFLDQLLLDPHLDTLPTHTYTLRPLRREALRAVIGKPAELAGIDIDEGLVDRLVDDTDTGEALPLLAFTLAQLADGVHRGGRLSASRYEQIGGVRGALSRQADTAVAEAAKAGGRGQEQVIAGLLRLVTVDEQGRPTRWQINRDDLPAETVTEHNAFVARRLLITDTDHTTVVIGVAHEAFLSAWPPLAEAIAANASALRARRAIEHAATEWHGAGRPPARLWGGGQLAAAVADTGARVGAGRAPLPQRQRAPRWLPGRGRLLITDRVDLSSVAGDFLHASIRHDRYRRRRASTVLAVLLILALVGGGVAVVQQRAAEQRQQVATARQLITQAEAALSRDPRTALRLAIAAHHFHPAGETQSSLVSALTTTHYAGEFTGENVSGAAVAVSPDGRTLAISSDIDDEGVTTLWDLTDPARPRQLGEPLRGHRSLMASVTFAPDGRALATGDFDGVVLLWDLTDPTHPRRAGPPLRHTGVATAAFAPRGDVLAVASNNDDGTVMLWDAGELARPRPLGSPLRGHRGGVLALAFAPDARTLATASNDNTTILWDLTDPAQASPLGPPLTGHTNIVSSVAFSPDGSMLATAGWDNTALLWDVTDRARPSRLGRPLAGHTDVVASVAFAPDGTKLITGSNDETAILWDLSDPTAAVALDGPLIGHRAPVESVTVTPDGRAVVTGSLDGNVILWNPGEPSLVRPSGSPLGGHTGSVTTVAFAPHGHTLATASDDHTVLLWNLTNPARPARLGQLTGHQKPVTSLSFAPDGRTLATASDDGIVQLWDVSDPGRPGRIGQPLAGHTDAVTSLAFAPDGRTLATAGIDNTVLLWNLTNPARPARLGPPLTGHLGAVFSVAFAPEGTVLATAGNDGTVLLWDVSDPGRPGRIGQPLAGHTDAVTSLAFAPDGRTLATASVDNTVVRWEVSDPSHPLRVGQPLTGDPYPVWSLAFDADGRTLATGSDDNTTTLWDLTNPAGPRRVGNPLSGHTNPVNSVAFSPDGRTLATGGEDGTTILWNLADLSNLRDRAVARACAITRGGLDRAEWASYLPDLPYQDTCAD